MHFSAEMKNSLQCLRHTDNVVYMQVSKGDFIIWNAAFWVATMHSVEVGLAAGLGTSIAIYVLRTVFAPLRQEGDNFS